MAAEKNYVSIPPDSTGKKILLNHSAHIFYSGLTDQNYVWVIGGRYWLNQGFTVHVHGHTAITSTTGILEVHYPESQVINNVEPIVGESIKDPTNVTIIATVASADDIYINANTIVGGDNPNYYWDIDRFGAGKMTFNEGAAEVSVFGSLRTSNQSLIASYMFQKNTLPQFFSNALIGNGSIVYQPNYQATELVVGDTLNDQATHTSNLYHPYVPGSGTLTVLATRIEDAGQDGLVRNWGAFDATDGFFFQLFGTELRVVHRSTLAGPGSTNNNWVAQENWNVDRVDGAGGGTNISGMELDVTKNNMYWVDFGHLGGHKIRWGVYYKGERLVVHEMAMENIGLHNAISNPNRPICWSTKCISASPGYVGTKSMYAYGAGVWVESSVNVLEEGTLHLTKQSYTIPATSTSTNYVFSARPVEQIDGLENHSLYIPKTLEVSSWDSTDDTIDVRTELRVFAPCVLRGVNYAKEQYSNVEIDTDGDHLSHGPEILSKIFKGTGKIDFNEIFTTLQTGAISVNAETTTSVRSQAITQVIGNNDASGIGTLRARITIGNNPYTGAIRHYFADRQVITVSGLSETGPNSLNGNPYYLSLISGDDAILYANLADLDDDRVVREITVSDATSIVVGDTITVVGAGEAVVTDINGLVISVEGRTNAALDVGLTGAAFTTSPGGGSGTVTSVAEQTAAYPKDYKTILQAVDGTGWATLTEGTSATNIGLITGLPPTTIPWTFMIRTLSSKANPISTRFNLLFKERIQ